MQSFSHISAGGHVGSDPVIRETQDKPFAIFSFAVNNRWKHGNEVVEKTDWYRVNVPAYLVNLVKNHVRKGDPVAVMGEPRIQSWTQGDKSFSGICIYASKIKLLGSKSENATLSPECVEESSVPEMAETAESDVDVDCPPFPIYEDNR